MPSGTVGVERRGRGYAFRNVPSFVLLRAIEAAGLTCDIAYGGAFYASVESPLPIDRGHLPELIALGRRIKREVEAAHAIVHPGEPELRDVYGVIFYRREGERIQRNVTIFADGEVDRSPCGSGTTARLAILDGTAFKGRVVGETEKGVVCEVEGSASLTGRHEFVLEAGDELGEGFLLR